MKFSLVNGFRQEAKPGLSGFCPVCDSAVIAKCGKVKAWHWAHRSISECDHWWENETEWHRAWKNNFPDSWQEIVHRDDVTGERHIADVKTDAGWVIEFQHSRISSNERLSRNGFYKKIVWVVNGERLKRDISQFSKAWSNGIQIGIYGDSRKVASDDCDILKEWSESTAPVFFDFGNPDFIYWVRSQSGGVVDISVFSRNEFITIHLGSSIKTKSFDELLYPTVIKNEVNQSLITTSDHRKTKERRLVPRHLARRL